MSDTTPVPETIGGTIPHETIAEAMREDGLLPAKLRGWWIPQVPMLPFLVNRSPAQPSSGPGG